MTSQPPDPCSEMTSPRSVRSVRTWVWIVTGARQRRVMVDGADACIFYDLVTIPVGPLPSSSWYHVRDGKIDSVRDYFDARVLVQGDYARHGVAIGGPRSAVGREVTQFTFPVFLSAEMEIAESNDP